MKKLIEKNSKVLKKSNLSLVLMIVILLVLVIVHILYKIPSPIWFLSSTWTSGDLLTFLGTTFLGCISIVQTRKANDMAKKANDMVEKANEIAKSSNNLTKRLLDLEEMRSIPKVKLDYLPEDVYKQYKRYQIFKVTCSGENHLLLDSNLGEEYSNGTPLYYLLRNVSDVDVETIVCSKLQTKMIISGAIKLTEYHPRMTVSVIRIEKKKAIPFILVMSENLFSDFYEHVNDEDKELIICLEFELSSGNGKTVTQVIEFSIMNAKIEDTMSCVINMLTNDTVSS